MAFQPVNERHAVQEAVFVLYFQRRFTHLEAQTLDENHEKWKADLPGKKRLGVLEFVIGEGDFPPAQNAPAAGVTFDAHKRDGSLDWRLRLHDNWLAVNCLSYTRWPDVSGRAMNYLREALGVVTAGDNPCQGIALQYIDIFNWEGDEAGYQAEQLLRKDSPILSKAALDSGPIWHSHSGWFRSDDLPIEGRILERIHLDGLRNEGRYHIKLDTTLRIDLARPAPATALFNKDSPMAVRGLEYLHDRVKVLLNSILTDEMIDRIQLNDA